MDWAGRPSLKLETCVIIDISNHVKHLPRNGGCITSENQCMLSSAGVGARRHAIFTPSSGSLSRASAERARARDGVRVHMISLGQLLVPGAIGPS